MSFRKIINLSIFWTLFRRIRQKISQVRRENVPIRPIEKVCTAFMKGKCHVPDCRFVHLIKPKRIESCKYWITDRCLHGAKCTFSHSTPCKYFHLYNYCQSGESCKFSHQRPLTDLAMKALMNVSTQHSALSRISFVLSHYG